MTGVKYKLKGAKKLAVYLLRTLISECVRSKSLEGHSKKHEQWLSLEVRLSDFLFKIVYYLFFQNVLYNFLLPSQ